MRCVCGWLNGQKKHLLYFYEDVLQQLTERNAQAQNSVPNAKQNEGVTQGVSSCRLFGQFANQNLRKIKGVGGKHKAQLAIHF